jgi:tetratricopeptide (TPR) repeat protein
MVLSARAEIAANSDSKVKSVASAPASTNALLARLAERDKAARDDIHRWVRETLHHDPLCDAKVSDFLSRRVAHRVETVRLSYEDFLAARPQHNEVRELFELFCDDFTAELAALRLWERERDEDSRNPVAWNNLAHFYGHEGPTSMAFDCYEKMLKLQPEDAVYYRNFAITVFLYRRDAMEYFQEDEQKVYDRSLKLYAEALRRAPKDFGIASELAESYFVIRPVRVNEAIKAWEQALSTANDEMEQGLSRLGLARFAITAGHFERAKELLNQVVAPELEAQRAIVLRTLQQKEASAAEESRAGRTEE